MKKDQEIYCNCCGKKIQKRAGGTATDDYVHIAKTWGYFSAKDGCTQTADICEACMDQWTRTFRIAPDMTERTEIFEC